MKLFSINLEVQALKTLCNYSNKMERAKLLAKLTTDHFYDDATKSAFDRISKVVSLTSEIPSWDELIVDPLLDDIHKEELKDNKIRKVKSRKAISNMCDNLNTYRKARILYDMGETTIQSLEKKVVNVDNIISKNADTLVRAQLDNTIDLDIVTIGHKSNAKSYIDELLSNIRPKVIRTGFYTFDKKSGGFLPGSLVILASTSGGGKSAMGNQLGINMSSSGQKVCFIPLEMTKKACIARVISNIAEINVKKYLFSTLTDNEKTRTLKRWRRFEKELIRLKGSLRIFEPENDISIEEILTVMRPYNDDVVIVDYIGLLRGVDGDDSWRKLGNAARFAKVWAKNNNKIVIMMAQLSDEGAIKYSRTVKEHADTMWSWVYSNESRENSVIDIIQQKARNQEAFSFQLGHDFSIMKIFDLEDDMSMEERRSPRGKKRVEKLKDASSDMNEDDIERYING